MAHYKSLSDSALHVIMRPFTQDELKKSKTDDGFDNSGNLFILEKTLYLDK
jgi:hypothetical protein